MRAAVIAAGVAALACPFPLSALALVALWRYRRRTAVPSQHPERPPCST